MIAEESKREETKMAEVSKVGQVTVTAPAEAPKMNGTIVEPRLAEESGLAQKLDALQQQVDKLAAESDIRKLHHIYGYYLDKCLYKEVAELFADHPDTYVQFLNGRFKGINGVRRLYVDRFASRFVGGRNGPVQGFLLDHLMAQDVVDWYPGTDRGKARIRTFMCAGTHESMPPTLGGKRQWFEGSLYENEYIKQNGVWKILRLRYYPFWHGTFEHGWRFTPENFVPLYKEVYPKDEGGPDEILVDERLWPDTRVVPFHYPHPVTGKTVAEDDLRAPRLGEDVGEAGAARVIGDAFQPKGALSTSA